MDASLYDVLRGAFHDGTPVDATTGEARRMQSVMSNLNRLFNTRQGSLDHLPGYGLPDLSALYQGADPSVDGLREAVKTIIQRYEPRLRRVHVEHRRMDEQLFRVTLLISAELASGRRVRFQTTFASNDLVYVRSVDRRGR